MNGDLSLSQTLGGLRIANPDSDEDVEGGALAITTAQPQPDSSPIPIHNPMSATATPHIERLSTPRIPSFSSSASATEDDPPALSSHSSGSTIKDMQRPRGLSQISTSSGGGSYQGDHASSSRPTPTDLYNGQPRPYRAPSANSDHIHNQQRMSRQAYDTQSQYSSHSQYSGRMRDPNDPRRPLSIYNHANVSSSSQLSHSSYRYNDNIQPSQPSMGLSRSGSRATSTAAAATGMPGQIPTRQTSRSYRGDPGLGVPRRSSRRVVPAYNGSSPAQVSPYGIEGGPLPSSEEWKEKGAAVSTRQEIDANGNPVQKLVKKGVKDFQFGRTLGEGSYSTVLAATDRQTMREYAIKVLDKRHIIKEKKVKYVNIEKDALNRLTEHPGVVRLYYTFQDERSLYFVLDVANGGELLGVLKRMGTFDEECSKFYSAQILDSIAYMHSKGIIHRDLKPENVLLDDNMHTKITDFGTAKILDIKRSVDDGSGMSAIGAPLDGIEQDRANSFVGTAEYVSPELLTDKNACKASDLWAFGCIVYQLLAGRPPFKAGNEYQTFQKIVALDYTFPEGFPAVARDLIERLLVLDPSQRLPIEHIMTHAFFNGIQWGTGLWKQKAPRLRNLFVPSSGPIKLNSNGSSTNLPNIPGIAMAPAPSQPMQQQALNAVGQLSPPQQARPQLRAITELAPPSQLDLDWSSVLTRNNERILKLGNMNVLSGPAPASPSAKGGAGDKETSNRKFSRFFGGSTTKRKERLVIITSSARLILAAAGGGEKKARMEIDLLTPGTTWKSYVDGRGLTAWSVDTVRHGMWCRFTYCDANVAFLQREKHFSFDDPRSTPSDPEGSKYSTREWLEMIDRAKEVAISQSLANSYSGESVYNDLASGVSSPASASGADGGVEGMQGMQQLSESSGRNTLRKEQQAGDAESLGARKPRFSKRHSKNGLAAVF